MKAASLRAVAGSWGTIPALTLFSMLVSSIPSASFAQPCDAPLTRFWRTDGPVYTVLVTNGLTYAGGAFSYVGPDSGGAGVIDLTTAEAKRGFPKIQGVVLAAVSDGGGGWFLGGAFTNVGRQIRTNLVHIRADNSVDALWAPHLNGICRTLLLHGGQLYVGGGFTRVGGITRNRIAAVNPVSGEVSAWNPNANQVVNTLALDAYGTNLYVGGNFTTIGSSNRNRLAALDFATGLATTWNPNALAAVTTIDVDGETVFVGGNFTTANGIGGQPRNRIAAIDASTGLATDWNPNVAGGGVSNLVVTPGVVFVGGSFSSIGGIPRSCLAAIDRVTGLPTDWNPSPNTNVDTLCLTGNALYAGGDFSVIGGASRRYVAALDPTNATVLTWFPAGSDLDLGVTPSVEVVTVDGNQVFVGSTLASMGGRLRNNIAAFSNASGEATDWDPNADASVRALAYSDSALYVGGSFASIGGQVRNRLAAFSNATGELSSWDPNVRGRSGATVTSLALTAGALYVGGFGITNVSGLSRTNLFAARLTDGYPTLWNPPTYRTTTAGGVAKLASDGASLIVGGDFTSIGGIRRTNLAALDLSTAVVESWDPYPNAGVSNVVVSGSTVYVGGGFASIGGVLRNRIGAVDRVTGLGILTWNPDAGSGSGTRVNALEEGNAVLYVGGQFTAVGGAFRTNGTAIQLLNGQAGSWHPGCDGMVWSMDSGENLLAVGGDFQSVAGKPHTYFAVFSTTPELLSCSLEAGSGLCSFQLRAGEGPNVVIERSIGDLLSWTPIWTNAITGVNIAFTDPEPMDSSPRFYRARLAEP